MDSNDLGRSAAPSGSRASHEAASSTASSPEASIPNAVNDWAIRLEWLHGGDVALSITGRTETRQGLEAFISDLELARGFLAATVEAHGQSEGAGA